MFGRSPPSLAAHDGPAMVGRDATRCASQRASSAKKFGSENGLPRWSFMPSAKYTCFSCTMVCAVMATIGRVAKPGSARILRVAASPSRTGI
jgi:hypothetical protein